MSALRRSSTAFEQSRKESKGNKHGRRYSSIVKPTFEAAITEDVTTSSVVANGDTTEPIQEDETDTIQNQTADESGPKDPDVKPESKPKDPDAKLPTRRYSSAIPPRRDVPEAPPMRRYSTATPMRRSSLAIGGKTRRKSSVTNPKIQEKEVEDAKKAEEPEVDPQETFRQFVYDTIRTTFQLVTVNDEININVDNVFPVLKTLELDANDEVILDMVRTSCIETFGDINEQEFDAAVLDQRRRATGEEFEEDLRSAFAVIDKDEDGFINTSDIYQLMMGIGEMLDDDELMDVMKAADYDKDGQINYRDFKYFLIGELDELPKEGDEEEAEEEGTEEQEKKEETTEEEKKEEPKEEVKEEIKEEVKEEPPKEPPKPKPTLNRKSVLWGYMRATTNVVETAKEIKDRNEKEAKKIEPIKEEPDKDEKKAEPEKKEEISPPEEKKEEEKQTTPKHDSGIGSEIESEAASESHDSTDGCGEVISVTVKHLSSITEEKMGDEDVFEEDEDAVEDGNELRPETPSRRTSRPQSSTSQRTRPMSGVTTVSLESGANVEESVKDKSFERSESRPSTARPKSGISRPVSASFRTHSAMSRVSSYLSTHSERDFMTTDTTETESLDLGIIDDNDDDDDRMSIDPDVFKTPMSERQVRHLDSFRETRAYSEVPSRTEIVYTSPTYSNYKDPKDHFQRFPKRESGNHVLERAKSASRIQSIRRIETAILRRQNTDSKLNVKRINVLNEQSKKEPIKTNANGMSCKHINIDLDYQNVGPSAKFESYSRDLLRRPKTALTFNERYTQLAKERMKEQEMSESPDPFVSIIDLTRSLKGNSAGYPENPELSLRHSGYKSVWPLARVKSARNQRINQGKNIELNSISRRLERTPIAWQSFESDTPRYDVQKGLIGQNGRNQAVITLEIPNLAQSKKNVKRMSPLSGLLPRTKLRG